MIKINQAVIVEGKYDKIKLSRFIDAPIITTDGFGIFKDKERQKLLRTLAKSRGLVVLTDSDSAGFIIRSFIGNAVDKKYIINAYIPDVYGKEKRKTEPSKEGMLGVEGMTEEVITKALTDAGVFCEQSKGKQREITKLDLFEAGFYGCADSSSKRAQLIEYFGLPKHLSTNSLVEVLNCITTKEGFIKAAEKINVKGE